MGRIITAYSGIYVIQTETSSGTGRLSGKLRHEMDANGDRPVTGDWVVCREEDPENFTILEILPRQTVLARKSPGSGATQILATNMDLVFIVTSANREFNPRRLERYLAMVWNSGATPVLILSKTDLCEDMSSFTDQLEETAPGVAYHGISSVEDMGLDDLADYLVAGKTIACVGSSGVGKSTLINRLAGREERQTQAIRDTDQKGRHTTTERHILPLPTGGAIIDSPGLRELQPLMDKESLDRVFEEIELLSHQCRFRDCNHREEPGCAVRTALEDGELAPERYRNYQTMSREMTFLAGKDDLLAQRNLKQKQKSMGKLMRRHIQEKNR